MYASKPSSEFWDKKIKGGGETMLFHTRNSRDDRKETRRSQKKTTTGNIIKMAFQL